MTVSRGTNDPIAAIATPVGRGGIGIVRISGPDLSSLVQVMAGRQLAPRAATLTTSTDADKEPIDQGIAVFFKAPNSFTGEDVLELQGHGGPAVMAQLLNRCVQLGCRIARPGEFTERAFLNEKLDLAQAESVADLIDAGSESAAKSAARTLTGEFSRRVHELTGLLINLRMHVEACIDFPEEEINPADRRAQQQKLEALRLAHLMLLKEARQGSILRDGLTVVLIGRPNVGKSSLLNRLSGEDLAIVTPIAGTTRDHVRATIYLEGVPIHLIDTAGLRETDDPVERVGIDRTWQAIEKAGAALLICEAGEMAGIEEAQILHRLPPNLPIAWVYNKVDLYQPSGVPRETKSADNHSMLFASALTGEGVDLLRGWLLDAAGWEPEGSGSFLARTRHLDALRRAGSHLERAGEHHQQYELFAEELRLAQLDLSAITGEFAPDDLLGEIFGRFCIGK